MNQFVIDTPANPSGLRFAYSVAGDRRSPASGRAVPVRAAWPFLVNTSAGRDKPARAQESGSPSGFAS